MSRALLLAALFSLVSGCGPEAGLWVRIEAPLLVPEQADGLQLIVRRPSGAVALDRTWDLNGTGGFPQTLALFEKDAGHLKEGPLEIEARVLSGDGLATPWSTSRASVTLEAARVEEVILRVCDCESGL